MESQSEILLARPRFRLTRDYHIWKEGAVFEAFEGSSVKDGYVNLLDVNDGCSRWIRRDVLEQFDKPMPRKTLRCIPYANLDHLREAYNRATQGQWVDDGRTILARKHPTLRYDVRNNSHNVSVVCSDRQPLSLEDVAWVVDIHNAFPGMDEELTRLREQVDALMEANCNQTIQIQQLTLDKQHLEKMNAIYKRYAEKNAE